MLDQFSRAELLFGAAGMERLSGARVAVFGLGGVGGYTVEALARGGIGALDLIDSDQVSLTNLNRQILATHQTLGSFKTDAAKERVLAINPEARVVTHRVFYGPDTAGTFDFTQYDYVVDAIDTVSETTVCPLARIMRKELKKRGIRHVKVVYSQEPPRNPKGALYQETLADQERRQLPGSNSFVPAVAGLILAGEVIKALALNMA